MLKKELVVRQLEADSHYRRLKWCPLVSLQKACALRKKFYSTEAEYGMNYPHPVTDVGIFPSLQIIRNMKGFEIVVSAVETTFPATPKILERFEGEVILAGGCLARAILSPYMDGDSNSHDADFFFIGCTKERILVILDEVEKLLDPGNKHGGVVRVTSLRTTTFYIIHGGHQLSSGCTKYQFIHSRSYPSAEAVILGFDIPAGAVFYDGVDILMTPMAAFTFATAIIFIDPSRRSTTYEKRLLKYVSDMQFALGMIATTSERIKQAYVGDRRLEARRLKHDLVPGIEIEIQEFGKVCIRHNNYGAQRDDVFGDYGAEAVNEYMIKLHNGFFALHGQVENIAWIKKKIDQKFTEPPVLYPKALVPPAKGTKSAGRHGYEDENYEFVRHVIGPIISAEEAVKVIGEPVGNQIFRHDMDRLAEYLLPKAAHTLSLATERLRTNDFEYIGPNDNPGRQHTSSFNPVYGDVRDYWFYRFYDVTTIGLPNSVYFSLKCVLKQYGIFEKGVLKIICNHVMTVRALSTLEDLMEGVTIKGEEFATIARQCKLGEDGSINSDLGKGFVTLPTPEEDRSLPLDLLGDDEEEDV